jgi:hypothetical protein
MVIPNLPNTELRRFIEEVYKEPYSLLSNNCVHKSIKIAKKAQELGMETRLVACLTFARMKILKRFPTIQPHMYVEVMGKRVDVSADPYHEEIFCKNTEKIILFPVKLPKFLVNGIRKGD